MSLAKALVAFQAAAPSLHKDAKNGHYNNEYVSLDGMIARVRPVLNEHGLAVLQMPTTLDGQPALRTVLLHESGEKLEDVMLLNAAKLDPQGQGSAITYARRYALAATLGLVSDEDDDGNATRDGGGTTGDPQRHAAEPDNRSAAQAASPASQFVAPPPREEPDDGGDPAKVKIHFGKNAGTRLGDLTEKQLAWYANTWEPNDSPTDRRLKAAAQELAVPF